MQDQNFSVAFLVEQTPQEAFNAINNVRGWWIDKIEGNTDTLGEEFSVRFEDIHYSKHKITALAPGKKIVWLTTDSKLNFLADKSEWIGTKVVFDITEHEGQTQVRFTHVGLVPQIECYGACSNAWSGYITGSVRNLIVTGTGQPTKAK